MATRGRKKVDTKSRDAAVVYRVAKAIFDCRGVDISLRDVPRASISRRSKSAYTIAQLQLAEEDRIFLGAESIAKIYRAGKAAYLGALGEGDVAANIRHRTKASEYRRLNPIVSSGDGHATEGGPRVRIAHKLGN